jgi:hypothetical protein
MKHRMQKNKNRYNNKKPGKSLVFYLLYLLLQYVVYLRPVLRCYSYLFDLYNLKYQVNNNGPYGNDDGVCHQ